MPSIKLIVTGDVEKLALHTSLQHVFPAKRDGDDEDVIWDKPRKLHCATSHQLSPLKENASNLSNVMKNLAQAMFDEAVFGKKGQPADLVIVIDDVELGNLEQESVIAAHFRAAVEHIFQENQYAQNTENRYRTVLREKCSFHLLKPMVESYFFGDPNALERAGVPTGATPTLVHPTDVELFETNDPQWLSTCHNENARRSQRSQLSWWRHEKHPKHYLAHLAEGDQTSYDETTYGKAALESLAWTTVPQCRQDTLLIRSLFEDIADWFYVPNPLREHGQTNPSFYPGQDVNRDTLILRNM